MVFLPGNPAVPSPLEKGRDEVLILGNPAVPSPLEKGRDEV